MLSIYQIYYDQRSKEFLEPAFYPYYNKSKDEYFENKVIREVFEMKENLKRGIKYFGVTSWKQQQKTHISSQDIIARINQDIEAGCAKDVYLISPIVNMDELEMHSVGEGDSRTIYGKIKCCAGWQKHKERSEQLHADDKLLNDSGVLPANLFDGKWQYSWCNYWVATREAYDDYCRNWLIPAMDFFKTVEHKLPRHYQHSAEGRMCTSICFTLEALFGSFLAHSGYSFEYLVKKRYPPMKRYKWINITGYENTSANTNLSQSTNLPIHQTTN